MLPNASLFASASVTLQPPSGGAAVAQFVKADTTTQGNWKSAYGGDGFNVLGDVAAYPAYASVTPSGNLFYVWNPSTADPRALQKSVATDRVAATWYTPGTLHAGRESDRRPSASGCDLRARLGSRGPQGDGDRSRCDKRSDAGRPDVVGFQQRDLSGLDHHGARDDYHQLHGREQRRHQRDLLRHGQRRAFAAGDFAVAAEHDGYRRANGEL